MLVACAVAARFWAEAHFAPVTIAPTDDSMPFDVTFFEPGWRLQVARRLPEPVSALLVAPDDDGGTDEVYVGTQPVGNVYRFCPAVPSSVLTVAVGLGDAINPSSCSVSALARADLDGDGVPELLAQTSQVYPRGRPRLYVWSVDGRPVLRALARPTIESSWSHGLGILAGAGTTPSIVSTYCGYGEIVAFQWRKQASYDGYEGEFISWRQIGSLPASGEGTAVADVDGDGCSELILATGFGIGKAAIHVYSTAGRQETGQPTLVIDEGCRFGNVRILVRSDASVGTTLFAWWCTELAGGECLIARYRLWSDGTVHRRVIARGDAAMLWPTDGQMTFADTNADGVWEVWFTAGTGHVFRVDSFRNRQPLRPICRLGAESGPVTASPNGPSNSPCLYIGCREYVLRLERDEPPATRATRARTLGGPSLRAHEFPSPGTVNRRATSSRVEQLTKVAPVSGNRAVEEIHKPNNAGE